MQLNINRSYTLSTKVLAAVSATFLVLFVGQYSIARYIISRGYTQLEQEKALTNIERLQESVATEIEELTAIATDWGWWNGTYEYVQDRNLAYEQENLRYEPIARLSLDFLVILDAENQPVFANCLDAGSESLYPLKPEMLDDLKLQTDRVISDPQKTAVSGLVLLDHKPSLVSISQIIKSDKTGPALGTLVMGRWIDDEKLAAFSGTTRMPIQAFLVSSSGLPADAVRAIEQMAQTQAAKNVQVIDEAQMTGYALISDVDHHPKLLLQTQMTRVIYQKGKTSLHYFLASTVVIGLVFCSLTLLLLRKLVLSRLESLSLQVSQIGSSPSGTGNGQRDRAIYLSGQDELSDLAQTINHTLNQLNQRTQELKLAKQSAEEAKAIADRANQAKSSFLANMSHELRTPLNAILGFAQVLTKERSLTDYQREKISIINRSGEHLLSLINDVLDMSKIESGRIDLVLSSFDFYYLLESLEDMLQLKAQSKGIELIVEIAESLPRYIYADERKLRQILLNLLSNAIKFTETGSVTLKVSKAALNPAKGQLDSQDDRSAQNDQNDKSDQSDLSALKKQRLLFAVTDTGAGISAEEIAQVFEPFVQTNSGRQSQEGTGLGLPISRKFVELMSGDLSVTSQIGNGSTFSFDIVVELADATAANVMIPHRQVVGLAAGQPNYRILVVDDYPFNRQLVRDLLVPIGFDFREAENGQQAIEIWETWQPDLIWMDMQMPVLNGYEATKKIRQQIKAIAQRSAIVQPTKIIALTASALEEERVNILAAGCDDLMRKPFHQEALFAKMAQHLGVCYRYEEMSPAAIAKPVGESDDLTVAMMTMPLAWREQLCQAASQLKEKNVLALIADIPETYAYLQQAIALKVSNFDFDQIEAIAEKTLKNLPKNPPRDSAVLCDSNYHPS
ncbi:MAG: hybrid sensor histidine kinase/response regulator [Phormidesmis priestleyi]|uniref:Circadian input-output histidine kinase CikA n=1 Tax=Phormidesmis priestleyi TaxID=268141 RepID=A0A2W4ZAB4_9CYAN|nr:MAG: hybrid sensor histidine kinase/response regulator [Phormidesmis priestleyi]